MKTEVITRENLSRYISMLSNDEIFDNESERLSCFGGYDEKSGEGMGVIAVKILPDYIRIEKVFTVEKFRKTGVATELLSIVSDLPEEVKMPFFIITDQTDIDFAFLKGRGFSETESAYKFIYAKLSDMREITVPDSIKDGLRIVTLSHVPENELLNYVSHAEADNFLQFPEIPIDLSRFSEGSLICLKDNSICAMMLIEESDEAIQITFMHCLDPKALYGIFALIKPALLLEYSGESTVRFLVCNKNSEDVGKGLFDSYTEKGIKLLKKG